MRRLYSAVVLLVVAELFGCSGSHSASLTPQSNLNGAVPASASRSALDSTSGFAADAAAASPPASPIKASPNPIAFVIAGQQQLLTISDSIPNSTVTVASNDPTIAAVSGLSVTAVAPGSTYIVVADQFKNKLKVPVTVGLAQFALQQYRSPATQSIGIYANGQTTYVNLTSLPSGCTNFKVSCLLVAPEVMGQNAFVFKLYDGQNGSGNLLSTATVSPQIISPSSLQKFSLPLGGAVSTLTIALGNPTPPPGTPTTSSVNITALDADGNTISGTGSYVNASGTKLSVSIADSDTSGITSVKPKSLTKPATLSVLSYSGTPLPSGATITASASGLAPVTTLFAPKQPGASKIYVTNYNNTVTTYNADGSSSTPTISAGLSDPWGVAVDSAGKIYVTSRSANTATTYNADGSASGPTITAGLSYPTGIAVDPTGKIYVTNCCSNIGNAVTTYNADGSPSTPTISSMSRPIGLAVDAAGKIYLVNPCNEYCDPRSGSVTTYNPDGSVSTPTISGLSSPFGVAVDATGKIYVTTDCCGPNGTAVTTYNADGSASTPTITAGLSEPIGVAVDAAGKIYVANSGNNTVTTYNADGTQTSPTITGLSIPYGIAVH